MKEASFWEAICNESVVCNLCSHHCQIRKDRVGICGVRRNLDGKLYSLNYGKLVSSNLDPIEKTSVSLSARQPQLFHRRDGM